MALRPRVLIDCDGVLADFLTPCLAIINRLTGKNHTLDNMSQWHIFEALGIEKKVEDAVYEEMKKPGWCRALPVYAGALEGIADLNTIADVYCVTSPMNGATWSHERERWLQHWFHMPRHNIIQTDAKYTVAGDFLIDDKISHVEGWKRHHPNGQGVVWHQVTNRHQEASGVRRTSDWNELYCWVAEHPVTPHRTWTST